MPKYGPEEINLICQQVGQLIIQSISQDLQQKLDCLNDAIGVRHDHLSTVCNHPAQSNAARSSTVVMTPSRPTTTQSRDINRSMNVMLFGVSEDKDASVWRGKADRALEFTAGPSVDVTDMFRVGRFSDSKVRPILVKLRNGWHRRIILINCHKLKDNTERIFIAPDKSLEERRARKLCTILLLQEHWLSDEQLSSLACIPHILLIRASLVLADKMCLLVALMADVHY